MSTPRGYFAKWPHKGEYVEDMEWACKIGSDYLKRRKKQPFKGRPCVIFDVDDTIIYTDPARESDIDDVELGDVKDEKGQTQPVFVLPPNDCVLQLVKEAETLGYVVIILTARPGISRLATIANLDILDCPFSFVVLNEKDEDPTFKLRIRKQLCRKYDVVLTVGDQWSDLLNPGTSAGIKLPDPDLKGSYIYFP